MPPFRSERRRGARSGVKSAACPCVADLIDFAEGRASSSERQRIEAHLESTSCGYCQSWIAKATSTPTSSPVRSARTKAGDCSEKAEISAWQRQAFRELEQRLGQLDEVDS